MMKMLTLKNISIGLVVSVFTLLIGISIPSLTEIEQKPEAPSIDLTEYQVDLADLSADPTRFDGKTIRVKGTFRALQSYSVANLESGGGWVRSICVADETSCSKLFTNADTQGDNFRTYDVEVLGRFISNTSDPHPLQQGERVRLLEITRIISIGPCVDVSPFGSPLRPNAACRLISERQGERRRSGRAISRGN